MITLGHVNIRTADIEATCAFYETVLGFRRVTAATNPDPAQNVWLCDDAGTPSLHVNTWRSGETVPSENLSSLHHFAFNCPDREAMAARLEAADVPYTVVETRVPGLVQFNLHDPNGVRVELTFGHELVQFPPA
jgi:catechol 2,3-dioxygenase-like lactoylglutathione lyase family enzyme